MTYFVWSLNRFVRGLIKVLLIYPLMLLTLLPLPMSFSFRHSAYPLQHFLLLI